MHATIEEEIIEEKKDELQSPALTETFFEREQYFSSSPWEKQKPATEEQTCDIFKGFYFYSVSN